MKNTLELIESLRENPAVYLGTPGISRLKSYLYGYKYTVDDDDTVVANPEQPLEYFSAWVAARFDWYEHTAGWCSIILKEADNDEEKALSLFFNLVDEYRATKLITISHVDTNGSHKPTGKVTTSQGVRELPPSLTTLKYFPKSRNCFLRYNYIDSPEECWKSSEQSAFERARSEFGIAPSDWSSAPSS